MRQANWRPRLQVVAVDFVEEVLHRRRAERLHVEDRAPDEPRKEHLRVLAERHLRLQVARAEKRGEHAVLALHQLRLLSKQVERLGLLRVRRVHLVRHLEERREVGLERDGGEVLLVDGVLALAAAVLRLQEVGKLALRFPSLFARPMAARFTVMRISLSPPDIAAVFFAAAKSLGLTAASDSAVRPTPPDAYLSSSTRTYWRVRGRKRASIMSFISCLSVVSFVSTRASRAPR